MAKLSSSELREQVISAGIKYVPAEQMFYASFPYKIELRPRHRGKGLGGINGKRSCQIDIANPEKARLELIAFNDRIEKILSNIEYRQEIREFVARLPKVEYKTRMGGDNNLFYLRDPELVMVVVERYKDVINNVTGPINAEHITRIGERNIVMRDKLYHNKYRFYLEFQRTNEFVEETVPRLIEALSDMDNASWREHKLNSLINYYKVHGSVSETTASALRSGIYMQGSPVSGGHLGSHYFPPRAVILYLTDPQDYVYLKLLAGNHIKSNHEIVLFNELT